jgi:hypothetical protein
LSWSAVPVLLMRGWFGLCRRHPYMAIVIAAFLRGLDDR